MQMGIVRTNNTSHETTTHAHSAATDADASISNWGFRHNSFQTFLGISRLPPKPTPMQQLGCGPASNSLALLRGVFSLVFFPQIIPTMIPFTALQGCTGTLGSMMKGHIGSRCISSPEVRKPNAFPPLVLHTKMTPTKWQKTKVMNRQILLVHCRVRRVFQPIYTTMTRD